jgi:putative ABC transport system ATP-binding protein
MESIITFSKVSYRVGDQEREILSQISFESAKPVFILGGPSGAGKTSLLRLVNGLASPSEGLIKILGKPIDEWRPQTLRQRVGYMAQQSVALTDSAEADLQLAAELSGQEYDAEQAKLYFSKLGLGVEMLLQSAASFSVGERQRFALIRVLMTKPRLLLADEPTSALDEHHAAELHGLLKLEVEAGLNLLLIEHRPYLLKIYDDAAVQRIDLCEGRIATQ